MVNLKNRNHENNEIPWKTMKTMNVHKNAFENHEKQPKIMKTQNIEEHCQLANLLVGNAVNCFVGFSEIVAQLV